MQISVCRAKDSCLQSWLEQLPHKQDPKVLSTSKGCRAGTVSCLMTAAVLQMLRASHDPYSFSMQRNRSSPERRVVTQTA